MKIPAKVEARITQEIKKLQVVLIDARKRESNEADIALTVANALRDVLGYKMLEEITMEHPIHGTFADLMVHVANAMRFIVEVKAASIELKDSHVTQVVNYAVNAPVDWVVLTNGTQWRAYKVIFGKPIDRKLVLEIDLCTASPKDPDVIEFFGNLSREVFTQNSMTEMFQAKQAMSRYSIAALLLSDIVVGIVRRELRKLADGLNPQLDDVRTIIAEQVIKRELTEADEMQPAMKAVKKLAKQQMRMSKARLADMPDAAQASPLSSNSREPSN
jgi:hypothetical protein